MELIQKPLEEVRKWDTVLMKPPSVCSITLDEFYEHYLKLNSIDFAPKYQRGRFRHDEDFACNLLKSIITYCVVMPVLLYKFHSNDKRKSLELKWEGVEGVHRMTVINCFMKGIYIQCEKKRRIMPYIFHEDSKTFVFYKKTPEIDEWINLPENKRKLIGFMTPEERERFNNFEIVIKKITSPLTLDERRQEFIKIQIIFPIRNNDLFKNFTHLLAVKNIMDNNLDEVFLTICHHLDKDITQYSTQWLIRFWLISMGHNSPRECMRMKDGKMIEMLENNNPSLVNGTHEQLEQFVLQFERFFHFFETVKEYIKFSPVAIYAIFERLRNADPDYDDILKTHVFNLCKNETKNQRKIWEKTNTSDEIVEYFDEFLEKLYKIKVVAEPEFIRELRKAIPVKMKNSVWKLNFDDEEYGNCFCCDKEICKKASESTKTWNCGHVVSDHDGGELTVENMRPVCFKCNQQMNTQNMMVFKSMFYPNV